MIKELVQFMQHLPDEVKKSGILPKEGLHIVLQVISKDGKLSLDTEHCKYELYNKPKPKEKPELSDFLTDCAMRSNHSWCIDTNKCFDLPTKAIHSCSPYCVAFKKEHLKGGEKYKINQQENKKQLYERFANYFDKALSLCTTEEEKERLKPFEYSFTRKGNTDFETLLYKINTEYEDIRNELDQRISGLKNTLSEEKDKNIKEGLKGNIRELENERNKYRQLEDSDYIIFYIDEPLDKYLDAHEKYLKDKLFNTAEYNTAPDEEGNIYGTSNFYNGFNSNMPFLIHQTATFAITSRISNKEAHELYNFEKILSRGFIPNPLPIFIYDDELEQEMVTIFRRNIEQGERISYQEMIKELRENHKADIGDYYILFHQNTKDGIIFNDFDFVSKFEYTLKDEYNKIEYWEIKNLFNLREKKEGSEKTQNKFYPKIQNVFDLEKVVFGAVLANKYRRFDFYFKDLEGKDFEQLDFTLIAARKYRKAIYDYIYKSKRQAINRQSIKEIMLSALRDDIKYGREYGIKEKLNIWFSINHHFDKTNLNFNNYYMPDKLDQLFEKTMAIADSSERIPIEDEYEFAFISGQLIDFLLSKSQSSDNSHSLLESFLQKSDVELFKKEISKYFARYKHAIERDDNRRFKHLMREIMGFEKKANMQDLLTFVLSGYFSNSFYYTKKTS